MLSGLSGGFMQLGARLGLTGHRLMPVLGVVAGMWALTTVSATGRMIVGRPFPLRALAVNSAWLVVWAALSPAVLWLAARFPLRREVALRSLLLHALAAAACAWVYVDYMEWLQTHWLQSLFSASENAVGLRAQRFQYGLFSYGLILSAAYMHAFVTELKEREVVAARLESELAQAQLKALKDQLQPHFFFNTLHAVTVLIRRDPAEAGRMVMRLSDLLRLALSDGDRQEASLAHELRFLGLYLEIEQTRFRDRLRVSWDVASDVEDAAVPTLVLQPLVENAIKHAIEPRPEGGFVAIAARREGDRLRLEVTDDGPGVTSAAASNSGHGIGIASTRGRLERLYGSTHRFTIEPRPDGGTIVTIAFPFRLHDASTHAAD